MDPADLYALACLAGGPGRAVDTAVVVLLADGRLQVSESGELSTAVLRYGHPVEAAVLDAVGRRARRSVETVRYRCGQDERLAGLVEQQASAGLLRRRRLPGRDRWTTTDAGRQRLAEARVRTDGGPPLRLALDGLDALPDQRLRIRVFDPPSSPRRVGGGHLNPGMATDRIGENGWVHGADAGDHGPRW
jgi:hypothetical protein